VCFDATHSVQQPGGRGIAPEATGPRPSAGEGGGGGRDSMPSLRGARGPDRALSDGPNSLTFPLWEETVADVQRIRTALMGGTARAYSVLAACRWWM